MCELLCIRCIWLKHEKECHKKYVMFTILGDARGADKILYVITHVSVADDLLESVIF